MGNVLEYKGYHTKIKFDSENLVLYGKIEGINDLVTFETSDLHMIKKEFESAVDDYLVFCEEVGKTPEKEYKGTFNVRVTPELHRSLAVMASKNNESLNQTVEKALYAYVKGTTQTEIKLQETFLKLNDTNYVKKDFGIFANGIKYGSDLSYGKYEIENIKMTYQQ